MPVPQALRTCFVFPSTVVCIAPAPPRALRPPPRDVLDKDDSRGDVRESRGEGSDGTGRVGGSPPFLPLIVLTVTGFELSVLFEV